MYLILSESVGFVEDVTKHFGVSFRFTVYIIVRPLALTQNTTASDCWLQVASSCDG